MAQQRRHQPDRQLPGLDAGRPGLRAARGSPAGAPIASFVSVPAHGDIVEGSAEKTLSADYFGFVRAALDERLGGINVVGPATLGRNETPIQVGGIEPAKWFGGVVTSIVGRAIADAHWLTADTLASAETFTRVPGHQPGAVRAQRRVDQLPDEPEEQEADGDAASTRSTAASTRPT